MQKKGARLGQHFLKGRWAARALARAAGITQDDTVLEIGPGKGALTRELLAVSSKVIAIEKDEVLVLLLNEKFANEIKSGALVVVLGDVRDIIIKQESIETEKIVPSARRGESGDGGVLKRTTEETQGHRNEAGGIILSVSKYVVAANIPYYITGEIIRQFLTAKEQPRAMALLVQKEVAKRIVSGKESLLSLSVKAYGNPKIVAKVPRGNFSPPPNVDSAILLIDNVSRDFFSGINEEEFFKVLHAGFKSKRKFLLNNLADLFEKENVARAFALCEINLKARAEDVPLEKWKSVALKLTSLTGPHH
ncbi:MAG: rRNA adenine dimethyltransferase family protein [bacterium]|nr:rRNA adenine dimethyltransferase family protein [bacterium]